MEEREYSKIERKKSLNFYEYAIKILGYKIEAFIEGDAYPEEWDLIIEILYNEKKKDLERYDI